MVPGSAVSWKLGAPTLALTSQEHLSDLLKEVATDLFVSKDATSLLVMPAYTLVKVGITAAPQRSRLYLHVIIASSGDLAF